MLEQHGLHRAHGGDRHPFVRMFEVGIVPGAVKHGHEPRGQGAIARRQILHIRYSTAMTVVRGVGGSQA